ncbi:hypothetical protein [Streptomyces sp. SID685]|uniref:hypothetical protein n=1 Tax=Streptomyces sp. SID685 TaxID=2690322 RepID=UPI0013691101|nr:hypothetical protein [Streptomyces sp. SID685]
MQTGFFGLFWAWIFWFAVSVEWAHGGHVSRGAGHVEKSFPAWWEREGQGLAGVRSDL